MNILVGIIIILLVWLIFIDFNFIIFGVFILILISVFLLYQNEKEDRRKKTEREKGKAEFEKIKEIEKKEKEKLNAELREKYIRKETEEREKSYINFKNKYKYLLTQFFEITERKVSILDDYGDENRDELPKQINIVIKKIAKQEGLTEKNLKDWDKYSHNIPYNFKALKKDLEEHFRLYHQKQKVVNSSDQFVGNMSGIDFEVFLSKKLKKLGYEVVGTSKTGDQGADLIASKFGVRAIIQAKRHKSSIGNKAVQEVVGALNFYKGNKAYVITNSLFTTSAKALAQKNNVILIDGYDLKNLEKFF